MKTLLIRLTGFAVTGILLFLVAGSYWGIWGEITEPHATLILKSLPPWQKRELADALNHYYRNNMLIRNTTGLLLSCEPTTGGIKRQFNWFYRDTASAALCSMPSYHELVLETCRAALGDEISKSGLKSTLDYELELARRFREYPEFTRKDYVGLGITGASTGTRLIIAGLNPFVGAAMTVVGFAQSALSDTGKAIPGIVCFMRLRCRNFIATTAVLWILCGAAIVIPARNRQRKPHKQRKPRRKKS